MSYEPMQYRFVSDRYDGVKIHNCEIIGIDAQIAVGLTEKWGMVAAMPDGEDSSGRQQFRLMTEAELAERAVTAAQTLVTALRAAGMIHAIPEAADLKLASGE